MFKNNPNKVVDTFYTFITGIEAHDLFDFISDKKDHGTNIRIICVTLCHLYKVLAAGALTGIMGTKLPSTFFYLIP